MNDTPTSKSENVYSVAASTRRITKQVMERQRRARINSCLNQIKTIILEDMHKDPTQYQKLEKADILEMTVQYLGKCRSRTNKDVRHGLQDLTNRPNQLQSHSKMPADVTTNKTARSGPQPKSPPSSTHRHPTSHQQSSCQSSTTFPQPIMPVAQVPDVQRFKSAYSSTPVYSKPSYRHPQSSHMIPTTSSAFSFSALLSSVVPSQFPVGMAAPRSNGYASSQVSSTSCTQSPYISRSAVYSPVSPVSFSMANLENQTMSLSQSHHTSPALDTQSIWRPW